MVPLTKPEADHPSAARDWASMVAMIALADPVAVTVGLALSAALAFIGGWGLLVPFAAWGAFGLIALVSAAARRRRLPGRRVTPVEEPDLADLVRQVAERLGFRSPLLVRVIPEPDAGVARTRVSGVRAYALILGWPLLRQLTAAQLAAVVAHELAHEQQMGDRRTGWLLQARESLVDSLDNRLRAPAALAARLLGTTQARSWRGEIAADAGAATVAGTAAVRGALERSGPVSAAFHLLGGRWAEVLAGQGGYPEDLYDALEAALADPHVARRAVAAVLREEASDPYSTASHPPLAVRLAALPERAGAGWDDSRPVPLRDAGALRRWCVRQLVDADELRPVRVLATAPEDLDLPLEAARASLMAATAQRSVAAAVTAAVEAIADGGWPRLAGSLEPGIRRLPPAVRAAAGRDVLVSCLGRVLAGELLDAGWTRASRWITSALASPGGEIVDLHGQLESAIDHGDAATVRALIATATPRATT